jgi:hypothetical protein
MLRPRRWIRLALQAGITLGLAVATVHAATPTGPEFQTNTLTGDEAIQPSVAMAADGTFLVVWFHIGPPGNGTYVQRFDAAGSPVGGPVFVAVGDWPSVAIAPDGRFVVAWLWWDSHDHGIFARRFNADATPAGPEFLVNTITTSAQKYPSAGMAPDGSFVVVWQSGSYGSHVKGQRFDAGGAPQGNEFAVSEGYSGYDTSLAMAADGSFVVAWTGADGSAGGPFARRMAADGSPLGDEFQVNTYTTNIQAWPDVDMTPSGDFVIAWHSKFQDGTGNGVFAQRYDASGATLGGEFQVMEDGPEWEGYPDIGVDDVGNFVVVWHGTSDGSIGGISGRSFDALGSPLGSSFQVNTYTTGLQGGLQMPIVSDGSGSFLATWPSDHGDETGWVIASRWLGCQPFPNMVRGLEVGTAGGDLVMTWDSTPGAESYHVLEDVSPGGGFHTSAAATGGCGDGVCVPGLGEDCMSCQGDCSGVQTGNQEDRFCCGDGLSGGENAVDCPDPRCTQGGFQCIGGAGVAGATVAMPAGDRFYLIAGRNDSCGFGPRK